MKKYIRLAKSLGMIKATVISPAEIAFDIRALLKCRWGCRYGTATQEKCGSRDTTLQERIEIVKKYNRIILVHAHDGKKLSSAVLEIERSAFLDGYYFAFAIRTCHLCDECSVAKGQPCPTPALVRPCDPAFGIDVYKTVRNLGLPCEVLQSKEETPNRYGFVLID